MTDDYISLDREGRELKRLKGLYNKAVREKATSFHFQGYEILTTFAKYYIEYIEDVYRRREGG